MERIRPHAGYPGLINGFRVYAIGDVHGRLDLLDTIFRKIDRDCLDNPVVQPIEVLLGDFIDRGPDSKGVIDLLLQRRKRRKLICLCGNHEYLLLGALNQPQKLFDWVQNGGDEALRSYGVRLPAGRDMLPFAVMRAYADALPDSHRRFLEDLPLTYSCGDYLFVHAGVRPGIPITEQSQNDLLWIREPFLSSSDGFGKIVVHGHTPVPMPDLRRNRINIDTGAYATGRLTCLVIDDGGIRFL